MSTPINPQDIRKGDRIRLIAEYTSTVDGHELLPEDGDRYELIERPVVLPTEPGTVIAIGEWWLVRLRPYMPGIPAAWELLPAPEGRAENSMLNAGVKAQCVYSDGWVQAEVDQDRNGFRVISAPIKEEATA